MLQTNEEDPDGLTTGQFLLSWLEHARTTLRPTTHEGYEALIRRHALPRIGGIPLGELRPLQIQALYAEVLAARGSGPSRDQPTWRHREWNERRDAMRTRTRLTST